MSHDVMIGLVVGTCLIAVGVALAAVSVWSRAGRSRRARWWVSPRPDLPFVNRPRYHAVALVILPMFAEACVALAVVVMLGPVVAPITGVALLAAVIVGLLQFAFFIFARMLCWQRVVLTLWVYPSWLRETRRQQRALLPAEMR